MSEQLTDLYWPQVLLLGGLALFVAFAVAAVWRDIDKWDMSGFSKLAWKLLSLSGVGFVLWVIVSNSEKKRRLERARRAKED